MTVVMGLHGLQIEKQAAEILQNLKTLNASFAEFVSALECSAVTFETPQINTTKSSKKLDRFGMQLEQIQGESSNDLRRPEGQKGFGYRLEQRYRCCDGCRLCKAGLFRRCALF